MKIIYNLNLKLSRKISSLKNKNLKILNVLSIIFILVLPYYIFEGKLFIGGDDTRLYYLYPVEWFNNMSFFSWFNFSSLGMNNPNQFFLPFLLILSLVKTILPFPIILDYLSFSFPLLLGLISFQMFMKELINNKNHNLEIYVGSVFYIFSPIIMITLISNFLYSVWLIALVPIIGFLLIKYLRTSKPIYIYIGLIISIILSHAIYSIPWLVGFVLPILAGLTFILPLYKKKDILIFIRKSFAFFLFIFFGQFFWLVPFILNFFKSEYNSYGNIVFSNSIASTFIPNVLATSNGNNIIYPLLNLFHKQLVISFNWSLKEIFFNFYDKIFIFNVIFIFVIFLGILNFNKYLFNNERKIFIVFLVSFLFSLFLFTVNIHPLKTIFLWFGNIPGFVMFRNFFDKFALGFVFNYSVILVLSLIVIIRKFNNKTIVICLLFVLVIINSLPIKQIINSPLWTTKNTHRTSNISNEYISFMREINNKVSTSTNILSLPFSTVSYSIIGSDNFNNSYIGTSPVKIFTGVNDFSGMLSFPSSISSNFLNLIETKDYKKINKFLYEYNINYLFLTKNIPNEIKNSYIFNKRIDFLKDKELIKSITADKIISSKNNNFELYTTKMKNSVLSTNNLYFEKINPVKYRIYIKRLKKNQELVFLDSFNIGWKLYPVLNPSEISCRHISNIEINSTTECKGEYKLFNFSDILLSFQKNAFSETHSSYNGYANKWDISSSFFISQGNKIYFKKNNDGTIDVEMILYFEPQNYFYLGLVLTLITVISFTIYLLINKFRFK